jgi:hypothetical protein
LKDRGIVAYTKRDWPEFLAVWTKTFLIASNSLIQFQE